MAPIELLHVPRLAAQPGGSMLEIDLPFYKNASVTRVQPLRRMLVRPRPS